MRASSDFHVFTTLLVRSGQPQYLNDHVERLTAHAAHFGITCPNNVRDAVAEYLAPRTYLLRIAVDKASSLSINTRELNLPTSYESSRIMITDIKVEKQFAAYKTSKRGPYMQAQQLAAKRGAFEALLIDTDGSVVDGYRSSPLLFSDGDLISLEGGLSGITREKVIREASKLGIVVRREKRKTDELDGVLLVAGSGIGLVPAQGIDDLRLLQLIDQFRPI